MPVQPSEYNDMKPTVNSSVIIMNVIINTLARYPQMPEDHTTLFMSSLSVSDLAAGCTGYGGCGVGIVVDVDGCGGGGGGGGGGAYDADSGGGGMVFQNSSQSTEFATTSTKMIPSLLTVAHAFPCRCHLANKDTAQATEIEIRQSMKRLGVSLVGWYHSHPKCNPDPSLNDIESQMEYQLMLRGVDNSYHPCLGVVVSPSTSSDSPKEGSLINAFWVMPPPETRPLDYGLPVSLMYNISSQEGPTDHVISEMKSMVEFYKGEEGAVNFQDTLPGSDEAYLDRLKASLSEKLSQDQRSRYLEFVDNMLGPS
ncbi:MPN domain-containing protein [Lamellibrachia satsuma]|nr:MPN domain-containing protein [Lamellibrachia satsuma]